MITPARLMKRSGFLRLTWIERAGLEQPHLLDHVQHQVGDVVHAVRAVRQDAADVDLGEVGVGAALGRGDAHLGRRGLVVELDPEALEQLFGLVDASACRRPARGGRTGARCRSRWPGQNASQVLSSVVTPRWTNQYACSASQKSRGACAGTRDADLGDALQLGFARRICLGRGQLARLLRVPLGETDHRVQRDAHRLEFLALGERVAIGRIVELGQRSRRCRLEVTKAPPVDLVVEHGVARARAAP